ncbi:GNAT family N-acetyltransferase [Actinoplanes sp. NPDC048796]|uniref:GNAT family N-acetyltransferase n=1 Tax=unclassified Actinoplanes TaxID=2626549 RepID=UPI0033D80732
MRTADRLPGWERMVREAEMVIFVAGRDEDADPGAVGGAQALYVRPDKWKKGVGRALMDAWVRRLEADGYRQSVLWVLAGNHRARRFCEATG